MDAPYREAPQPLPIVALREVTAPLGVGRGAAAALLLAGLVGASVTQATELECFADASCTLTTHSGLSIDARPVHGSTVALPSRGLYYDPLDVWRNDDRLADTAHAFFHRGIGSYFTFSQRPGPRGSLAFALSLLAPLAGVVALLFAERRTRLIALTIDLTERVAHASSVGLGGAALDRTLPFGEQPRLQRVDHPSAPSLPMLRVASQDGGALPLLTGHDARHRVTFDRLVARANRALAEGTPADPSPSPWLRLAPSALLLVASLALFARVTTLRRGLPPTTGTIALTSSATRCAVDAITLLRGGRIEWEVPAGLTARTLIVTTPDGAKRTASVTFAVRPDARTAFDCAQVMTATGRLWVTPNGLRTDEIPSSVPRE